MARNSRCIFVGNIPYGATAEHLTEIFSEVGPVVNFRLLTDKDTGRPKGYGFCEYRDAETALSAIRNLNNRDLNGRQLRVDFAENEKSAAADIPVGMMLKQPEFATATDAIAAKVDSMSQQQLYQIFADMKSIIANNREEARQILIQNPQLSIGLLHAQIKLGLVKQPIAGLGGTPLPQPPPRPSSFPPNNPNLPNPQNSSNINNNMPAMGGMMPPSQPPAPQNFGAGFNGGPAAPLGAPSLPPSSQSGFSMRFDRGPTGGRPSAPTSVPTQPPPQAPQGNAPQMHQIQSQMQLPASAQQQQSPEMIAHLRQIMALTPQQIESLPEQYKQQILALQQQMAQFQQAGAAPRRP